MRSTIDWRQLSCSLFLDARCRRTVSTSTGCNGGDGCAAAPACAVVPVLDGDDGAALVLPDGAAPAEPEARCPKMAPIIFPKMLMGHSCRLLRRVDRAGISACNQMQSNASALHHHGRATVDQAYCSIADEQEWLARTGEPD